MDIIHIPRDDSGLAGDNSLSNTITNKISTFDVAAYLLNRANTKHQHFVQMFRNSVIQLLHKEVKLNLLDATNDNMNTNTNTNNNTNVNNTHVIYMKLIDHPPKARSIVTVDRKPLLDVKIEHMPTHSDHTFWKNKLDQAVETIQETKESLVNALANNESSENSAPLENWVNAHIYVDELSKNYGERVTQQVAELTIDQSSQSHSWLLSFEVLVTIRISNKQKFQEMIPYIAKTIQT